MATTDIKLVTWNVDGINEVERIRRAKRACDEILAMNPDVVSLQEVVAIDDMERVFDTAFGENYMKVCPGGETMAYFTVTYIKKCWASGAISRRDHFEGAATSMMGRDMLCMTCNIKGIPLLVVNTHLESMKESSETRTAQLKTITRLMLQHEGPAMVGGDLNMRDREQKDAFLNAGGADDAMTDAYFFFNRPADARVTWELPDTPQAKGRFDRIYHNRKGIEFIHNIVMLGKQTIQGVGVRPSDHLGLVCSLRVQTPGGVSASASTPASIAAPAPVHQASKPTTDNSAQASPSKKRSQPQPESGSSPPPLEAEVLRLKRLRRFDSTKEEQVKPKTEPVCPAFLSAPSPSTAAEPCVEVIDLT